MSHHFPMVHTVHTEDIVDSLYQSPLLSQETFFKDV